MEAFHMAEQPIAASSSIGVHAIADLSGIDASPLKDEKGLMDLFRAALNKALFTIMDEKSFCFPGENSGVTGMFILSESHAAFHSYPEFGYIALDVFSCGDADPENVIWYFAKHLNAKDCKLKVLDRGHNVRM